MNDKRPRDIHEAEIDIFNTALDYMSYDEWIELCKRINDAYNAKNHKEDIQDGSNE